MKVLSLEEMRALPKPGDYDSGVYFLWKGSELLYIGKSRNLAGRAYYQTLVNRSPWHLSPTAKYIPADAMTCLVLESGPECLPGLDCRLQEAERAYLAAYQTPYNFDTRSGFT